ncbi:hypothetical protein KIV56_03950 [Cryobacterium breve]|uniref:PIN domain-containing protein n=1 Tax=Cryobacterium breve TaxID=1259258 RepID=A0ABY7NE69_9MICO|nr:hypothetical protein [Cryobacterium breve]WBM80590.1 hypothetical protein KIV56_03950 [Cryobacterium breve]
MTAPDYIFPDNTVLINFAIIGQLPLLKELLQGKGAWVAAVAAECELSVLTGLYPTLGTVAAMMAEPLMPTAAERVDGRAIRNDIAAPYEPFPKSYGEAETLAIIERRNLSALVITDDGGVGRYVKDKKLGVKVLSTTDILALSVRTGRLTQSAGEVHIATLCAANRRRVSLNLFRAALPPAATGQFVKK